MAQAGTAALVVQAGTVKPVLVIPTLMRNVGEFASTAGVVDTVSQPGLPRAAPSDSISQGWHGCISEDGEEHRVSRHKILVEKGER